MTIAKDFLGNDIEVGDKVVFTQLKYRNFMLGEIAKITPKLVIIKHDRDPTGVGGTETKQFHGQVIVLRNIKND